MGAILPRLPYTAAPLDLVPAGARSPSGVVGLSFVEQRVYSTSMNCLGIPILTYHALHAPGWDYESNDHVALATDLELLKGLGFRVVALAQIVDALIDGTLAALSRERVVGVSLDDGTDHDWFDYSHPDWGSLRSMASVLREEGTCMGFHGGAACATSFVIVSPCAREQLDRACMAGRGQWRDSWWKEAHDSGLLTVANHSWDHLHPALDSVCHSRGCRGDFHAVDNPVDADEQLIQSERYLRQQLGGSSGLFAYPFGHVSAYLRDAYFPSGRSGIRAAFAAGGGHCLPDSDRWSIPRWVCQQHWRSSDELARLLE